MRDKLAKLEKLSPFSVIASLVAGAIAFAVLLDHVEKLKADVESIVLLGIQPAAPTSLKQAISNWLFISVLGLIILTISLGALYLQAEIRRRNSVRYFDERKTKAYATLQGMMRAAARIRTQSYPNAVRHKSFRRIHLRYLLDKNFSAKVTRSYTIAAVDGPVHFWQESYRVRDAAEATEYLLDINFKVKSRTGDLVYLPTEIDGRSKAISLYFLPQITPDENGREIEISYAWPGLARSLKDYGEEVFSFNYDSLEQVEEVILDIFLEPGTTGNIHAEIAGTKYSEATIIELKDPETEWPGIRYSSPNSPEGSRVVHSILVKWRSA